MRKHVSSRIRTAALVLGSSLLGAAAVWAAHPIPIDAPKSWRVFRYFSGSTLPANPFLASGVAAGQVVEYFTGAGTGPTGSNPLAPSGTPARYINYDLLAITHPDFVPTDADKAAGVLPPGVTITEAQGLSAMAAVKSQLALANLGLDDVVFMRIYLDNVEGEPRADYNGWNRAYRKYMANVDLTTGEVIPDYEPVLFVNDARPARSNLEVASLPVAGWLVEIEVIGVYPDYLECYPPFGCGEVKKVPR